MYKKDGYHKVKSQLVILQKKVKELNFRSEQGKKNLYLQKQEKKLTWFENLKFWFQDSPQLCLTEDSMQY